MRKVCVVLTARTSYTKIKPILRALSDRPDVDLRVICAASAVLDRYGEVSQTVLGDGFPVDESIHMLLEGESLETSLQSLGVGLLEFGNAFRRVRPDVVVVMADRYEVMAPAVAAAYLNIPLAHVQGGEVSGNIDEKVRHAITKLADLHFPATERARQWLLRMGERPEKVHLTGCPSIDVAKEVLSQGGLVYDPYERYGGVGDAPDLSNGFIVVMQHPVTTEHGSARMQAEETLKAVGDLPYGVLWFWPNPDAGSDATSKAIRAYREIEHPRHMHFFKNMQAEDFLALLAASRGIVGNSSVGIRECSYLGVPAVNIGSRQANRERGPNVRDVAYSAAEIREAIESHLVGRGDGVRLYGSGDAGVRIAEILATQKLEFSKSLSYVDD